MLSQYKDSGKFLFSTFMQYGVAETIQWFAERGVELVEENEGRLFPSTHQAETICAVMRKEVKQQNVTVKNGVTVTGIVFDDKNQQFTVSTKTDNFTASACVVATGGTARPETGSSGEGFDWLRSLGHTIISNNMALVPLVVGVPWISRLSGVTLPNIKLTIYADDVKQSSHKGKLLFTHVGVTGPTILNLSKTVGELLEESLVTIKVDFLPLLDAAETKVRLQTLLTENSNKKVKNIISELVPAAVGEVLLVVIGLDGETPGHGVSKTSRVQLLNIIKAFPLQIDSLLGEDKAIVSDGGVKLEEIDFKTMESRILPNLYLVGDVLNINRPSGGYSLQICWSTGFVAGDHA
jgi:predicted Rossmann fold flavoprotein